MLRAMSVLNRLPIFSLLLLLMVAGVSEAQTFRGGISGRIADAEISTWLASIERAIEQESFFFVLPQFVVRGVKK